MKLPATATDAACQNHNLQSTFQFIFKQFDIVRTSPNDNTAEKLRPYRVLTRQSSQKSRSTKFQHPTGRCCITLHREKSRLQYPSPLPNYSGQSSINNEMFRQDKYSHIARSSERHIGSEVCAKHTAASNQHIYQ